MGVTLFSSVFAASVVIVTLSVEALYLYAIKFPSSKYQCTNGMTVELQITDSVTMGYRQGLMIIHGKFYPGLYWTRGVSSEFNGRGIGF